MLDPAPRVVLDPQLGFAAAGRDAREAAIIEELYDHTIDVILRAEALGGWRGVGEQPPVRHRVLGPRAGEAAQGRRAARVRGEVALVTGAASGIGKACVDAFLRRGAAVVGLDRNPAIASHVAAPGFPRPRAAI